MASDRGAWILARTLIGLSAAAVLFAADFAWAGEPMRFRLANRGCPEAGCIVAAGEIGPSTAKAFSSFLKWHAVRPGALVLLNSPGGDLVQGLKLGLMIRRAGLDTRVQAFDGPTGDFARGGQCASACAYAFLGGLRRYVPEDARYGIHRFFAPSHGKPIDAAASLKFIAMIFSYLDGVGADEQIGLAAFATPANTVRWLTQPQLAQLHITPGSRIAATIATTFAQTPAKVAVLAEAAPSAPAQVGSPPP